VRSQAAGKGGRNRVVFRAGEVARPPPIFEKINQYSYTSLRYLRGFARHPWPKGRSIVIR
jgi:hypothetical protein